VVDTSVVEPSLRKARHLTSICTAVAVAAAVVMMQSAWKRIASQSCLPGVALSAAKTGIAIEKRMEPWRMRGKNYHAASSYH
jgi:hypothetical protein